MTFVIRPLQPEADLSALVRLRAAVAEADPTGEAGVRERLGWKNQDPLKDHWVAERPERPGELLGYANILTPITQRCDTLLEVHPAWRRRGLGSALLQNVLRRASEKGVRDVAFYERATQVAAQAFLSQAGFEQVGEAWELQASAEASIAEPAWPPDYRVTTYAQVPDLPQLVEICNRSRRDMWGHWENYVGAVTAETLMRWLPHWDWNGIFLVFAPTGAAVGVCRVEAKAGDPASLDPPTIVPEERPLQLQRPLLLTAWQWARAQGAGRILLQTWGDAPSTVAMYRELGFEDDAHYLAYRYPLVR